MIQVENLGQSYGKTRAVDGISFDVREGEIRGLLGPSSPSMLLGALVRTEGQASSIGWILDMVLAGMGNCWWPGQTMPRWMWDAAHVLPTAWAKDGF